MIPFLLLLLGGSQLSLSVLESSADICTSSGGADGAVVEKITMFKRTHSVMSFVQFITFV